MRTDRTRTAVGNSKSVFGLMRRRPVFFPRQNRQRMEDQVRRNDLDFVKHLDLGGSFQ